MNAHGFSTLSPEQKRINREKKAARFGPKPIVQYPIAWLEVARVAVRMPGQWLHIATADSKSTAHNTMRSLWGFREATKAHALMFIGLQELRAKGLEFEFRKQFLGMLPPRPPKAEQREQFELHVRLAPHTKSTADVMAEIGLI